MKKVLFAVLSVFLCVNAFAQEQDQKTPTPEEMAAKEADRLGEEGPKEEKMDPQQEKSHRTGWLGGALLAGAALGTFWAVRGRKRQKSRPSRD